MVFSELANTYVRLLSLFLFLSSPKGKLGALEGKHPPSPPLDVTLHYALLRSCMCMAVVNDIIVMNVISRSFLLISYLKSRPHLYSKVLLIFIVDHTLRSLIFAPGLFLSNTYGFTNTGAVEAKDVGLPINIVDMSQTEPSPDSKRMSTFKPEESTHL